MYIHAYISTYIHTQCIHKTPVKISNCFGITYNHVAKKTNHPLRIHPDYSTSPPYMKMCNSKNVKHLVEKSTPFFQSPVGFI